MGQEDATTLILDPLEELDAVNSAFRRLLGADAQALLPEVHHRDDLLVRLLVGGKDVGKSTFLNRLLGADVSVTDPGSAAGTARFVAYVHFELAGTLRRRLESIEDTEVEIVTHDREAYRRLCLVDSPDCDSRFPDHASRVKRILAAGMADGVLLMSSPSKYKDLTLWELFGSISSGMTASQIIFVLTKADELGGFFDRVKDDFIETVTASHPLFSAGGESPGLNRVFLIDSINGGFDFEPLAETLLRPLRDQDVNLVQQDNRRHVLKQGITAIEERYRLDDVGAELERTSDPERVEEIFDTLFPEAYFETVEQRLAADQGVQKLVRDRLAAQRERTLAGVSVLLAVKRWLADHTFGRLRFGGNGGAKNEAPVSVVRLLRWGQMELGDRIEQTRRKVLTGLKLVKGAAQKKSVGMDAAPQADLDQLLEDLAAGLDRRGFSWPLRLLLNLPVYLYLVLFVLILLHPVLLLANAFEIIPLPDLSSVLTLSSVKVSLIGLAGYYIMAAFFVIRRSGDLVTSQTALLSRQYAAELRRQLLESVRLPLDRYQDAFLVQRRRLERLQSRS